MTDWSTKADLLLALNKKWHNQKLLKSMLQGTLEFPMQLPIRRPTGRALLDQYAQAAQWIGQWEADIQNEPVRLVFEQVQNRHIQTQHIPRYLCIDDAENLWQWLDRSVEVALFTTLYDRLTAKWPVLAEVVQQSPFRFLEIADQLQSLIAVLSWFETNPNSDLYLRQLDIPGVHTKFIETNKRIIHDCLSAILPSQQLDESIISLAQSGFERKFGLNYDLPTIRFRILDPKHYLSGLSDLALPLTEFAQLSLPVKHVFITENKINGLAFPQFDDAIVIFGLGYGAEILAQVSWLAEKKIWYWGDIDTHGFNILAQFRKYWPMTKSLLMDQQTLLACEALWVKESTPMLQFDTTYLHPSESEVLAGLWQQRWHEGSLRLEQEVIPFHLLEEALTKVQESDNDPQL